MDVGAKNKGAGDSKKVEATGPIIGILSQETKSIENLYPEENFKSFIAASYVKYVESAGGRVMPIWIGRDDNYYRDVVKSTNGVLFPGGATWFEANGYGEAGQKIYNFALEANRNGDHYPIWGTCLGMELLLQVSIDGKEMRSDCDSCNVGLPLHFVTDYKSSRLFSNAPENIIETLCTKKVTVNNHKFCFIREIFTENHLDQNWRILSFNNDSNGLEFISSYEHKLYPFYGVQFHPEKNPFEFGPKQDSYVDHSKEAIEVSQYFSNFFMAEARRNEHTFGSHEEELSRLIYNFNPRYSALRNSQYQQIYGFTTEQNLS